ncbi:MAG: hypothetical protein K2O00_01980 [Muribaculaceae bacterium]|nr:hypothetical protein [Muribaculaceae bacterium]
MNLLKSNDSLTEAGALMALSCLPFYTLGELGAVIPLWIAYIIGGATLLLFTVRICAILFAGKKPVKIERVDMGLKFILGLAFPLGVVEAIMEYAGNTSDVSDYFFAGLMFLVGLAIMFMPERKPRA